MKRVMAVTLVVVFAGLVGVVRADDKPNPTGTWKWTVTRGGQSRDVTLKLQLEGDKLTGAMLGRNNQETPIQDASYKDGEVSFKVTRKGQNGQEFTTKYTGKVSGDSITGTSESSRGGQARSEEWTAKRSKD